MAILRTSELTKIYQENSLPVTALRSASIQIEEGEFVALAGPSGSGKSTFLNLVGCLDRPTRGSIFFDGQEISAWPQRKLAALRLKKIGFIFQDFNLIPTLTARENIEYVLWLQGVAAKERQARCFEICKRFHIETLIHRKPSELSRGQQQRVAVARAIAHKPRIVLGDELTANLDHKTGAELMDFLKELNRSERSTFLYATHDPVMLERAARVIKMQDGRIIDESK